MRLRLLILLSIVAAGTIAIAARGSSQALRSCPTHDPGAYHSLVDRDRGCHHDHEHKDDPRALNGLFGKPGAWFGGGGISYPWQTFKGAGEGHPRRPGVRSLDENALKHWGYGWGVRKGLRCTPAFDAEGCLTDIRMQVHAMATVHDATTRFHSFSLEARGCIGGRCGIIREGGWIDYGRLRLDEGQPSFVEHVPLPGDPTKQTTVNPRRIHKSPGNNQRDATWYSQAGPWNQHLSNLGLRFEMWGPVDPNNLSRELTYCELESARRSECRWNGSWLEVHLVPIRVPAELDSRDGKRDGLVTFRGFADRYGKLRPRGACRRAGLDCVPLRLEQMPVGYYQYRDDVQGIAAPDHDTSPAGRWWLRYPRVG